MGLIASSDNHVGMPGRSYPGDRQIHTPFPGGLCAIWAPELTRDALFSSLRQRQCYGTTGARIIVRFCVAGSPMGSTVERNADFMPMQIEVRGTAPIEQIEVLCDLRPTRVVIGAGRAHVKEEFECDTKQPAMYYLRVKQIDGQRAWTSPIWVQ